MAEVPRADVLEEANRILEAASDVVVRLLGGVAIRLRCESAARPPLARQYGDIDFFGRSSESDAIIELVTELGYRSERRFNALHGHRRLLFKDDTTHRNIDVLLDHFEMCHRLDLRGRLDLEETTLPLADLLLTKLQVVEMNKKDITDATALLVDHAVGDDKGIDADYIAGLCAEDWGLHRTVELTIMRLSEAIPNLGLAGADVQRAESALSILAEKMDRAPKTLRWKARARVGERIRWYELPEEVG